MQQPIGNWRTKKRNVEAVPEIAAAAAKKKNLGEWGGGCEGDGSLGTNARQCGR